MSNLDEELQKKFEMSQAPDEDTGDAMAYRHVFRALNAEPSSSLPSDFADRVVKALIQKQTVETRREMWWFGFGIFMLVVALAVAVGYTGFKMDLGFLKKMSAYSGIFVFGVAFVLALNFLEKKVLKQKAA